MDKQVREKITGEWNQVYAPSEDKKLQSLLELVEKTRQNYVHPPQPEGWYKDAVVYSLYVDLFNHTFDGLIEKLPHLQTLGVTCLWLLPILDSPMRDAGFDIRDYRNIRAGLLGLPHETPAEVKQAEFRKFLEKAHAHGIRVIFDIAMNHTSEEHPWFVESRKGPDNPYRDYYMWEKDTQKYREARIIFKGMVPSNWQKDGDYFFFHRFFEFQPDLNYRNPDVITEVIKILLFWLEQGLDGFRADAIPYIWKEDGTNCENLPQAHNILKIFRAVLDYVRPNTLLLAEACQPPHEVVKYFGEGDECHAGYHFPLMPMIFKSLAIEDPQPIENILHPDITPVIRPENQWFTFLRLHDELTLEMVSPEDREIIHSHYCKDPLWDFRVGEGIAARLSELLDRDHRKIALAYSIMLTLPGTPIIYYGDEFAKLNDIEFYHSYSKMTGKEDTRYLARGYMDWNLIEHDLQNDDSLASKTYKTLKQLLKIRSENPAFRRGKLFWIKPEKSDERSILAYRREYQGNVITVMQNLSENEVTIKDRSFLPEGEHKDLISGMEIKFPCKMLPYQFVWIGS